MKDGKVVWKKIQSLQEVSTGVLLNIFGSKCIWFLTKNTTLSEQLQNLIEKS
jgi:hypothetical protein